MTEEDVAVEAALAAARLLHEPPARVSHKGRIDLVTEKDVAAEDAVRRVLAHHTPDIPVLGEEGGGAERARTRWVVDPLDGTTNFVHGFPFWAVSVGLEIDGEPRVGVVVDVPRNRVYRGTIGAGASVNGAALCASDVRSLEQALCGTGFPYDRQKPASYYLRIVGVFLERTQGIRRAGAAALDLALVAEGRLDLFWEFGLRRWDVTAGLVLVREAGGRVSPIPGFGLEDPACPIATNPWLHDEVSALIADTLEST